MPDNIGKGIANGKVDSKANGKAIGRPTPLIEGRAKVTGAVRYTPDLYIPGMLHARRVTSIYGHGNIRGLAASKALSVPGVVAVLTADDMPNILATGRPRLLLARGRVMFMGQPIAMVLATSEAAADDGMEQVSVDYEPLPAAITIDEAMAEGAPLVWPNGVPDDSGSAAEHGADSSGTEEGNSRKGNIAGRKSHN